MKMLKNFCLLFIVSILLFAFVSCKKEDPIIPDPEPSEYIRITLKAVASNLYNARLIIPELDYNNSISGGDDTYSWKSIDFPFKRENYEDKNIAITMKVFLYPDGYPGEYITKEETKIVLISDDTNEVVWDFYD